MSYVLNIQIKVIEVEEQSFKKIAWSIEVKISNIKFKSLINSLIALQSSPAVWLTKYLYIILVEKTDVVNKKI